MEIFYYKPYQGTNHKNTGKKRGWRERCTVPPPSLLTHCYRCLWHRNPHWQLRSERRTFEHLTWSPLGALNVAPGYLEGSSPPSTSEPTSYPVSTSFSSRPPSLSKALHELGIGTRRHLIAYRSTWRCKLLWRHSQTPQELPYGGHVRLHTLKKACRLWRDNLIFSTSHALAILSLRADLPLVLFLDAPFTM